MLNRRTRRGSRGAAMVEGAFVLPLLVIITFGAFEFGLFFLTQSAATSSTQSGARIASASLPIIADKAAAVDAVAVAVGDDTGAMTGLGEPEELWIYRADPNGFPVGGANFSACPTDCRQYSWNGSVFVYDVGTWAAPDACLDGGLDNVGVYLRATHTPVTGLVFGAVTVSEHTIAQLEPLPSEECP